MAHINVVISSVGDQIRQEFIRNTHAEIYNVQDVFLNQIKSVSFEFGLISLLHYSLFFPFTLIKMFLFYCIPNSMKPCNHWPSISLSRFYSLQDCFRNSGRCHPLYVTIPHTCIFSLMISIRLEGKPMTSTGSSPPQSKDAHESQKFNCFLH